MCNFLLRLNMSARGSYVENRYFIAPFVFLFTMASTSSARADSFTRFHGGCSFITGVRVGAWEISLTAAEEADRRTACSGLPVDSHTGCCSVLKDKCQKCCRRVGLKK